MSPNSSSSFSLVPHAVGIPRPGGRWTCLRMVAMSSWMKPVGVQLARPISRPAGTRASVALPLPAATSSTIVGTTLQLVGESLCEALDLRAGALG